MGGRVIGSCGDDIDDEWFDSDECTIAIKDRDKRGRKAIAYPTVCRRCYARLKKLGLILETDEEQREYLCEAD